MTPRSALEFDVGVWLLAVWTLRLVRRDRLYVGYGVIVLGGLAAEVICATFGSARLALMWVTGTSTSFAAIGVVSGLIVAVSGIYFLSQMTVLSNRLTKVVQELALAPYDDTEWHDQRPSSSLSDNR
jgi:uncharacterized protein DUF2304